jgi:ABC-type lipoprotein export system ATPase subunit
MANRPRVILADEPTGNLDSRSAEEIGAILKRLCTEEKVTIVVVTHSESVARWAERRLAMQDGRMEERTSGPETA